MQKHLQLGRPIELILCSFCGRYIRMTKSGVFRRHMIAKGNVCPGSWMNTSQQWAAIQEKYASIAKGEKHAD